MKAPEILKKIYTQPTQAFDRLTLEASFQESVLFAVVLVAINWGIAFQKLPAEVSGLKGIVLGLFAALMGLLIGFLSVRQMVRWFKAELPPHAFISGFCWITVALWPINFVMALLTMGVPSLRWVSWVMVVPTAWLAILCLNALTGLSKKDSILVMVLSYLMTMVLFGLFMFIFGVGYTLLMKFIR